MQVSHVTGFLKCDWIRILNRTEEILSQARTNEKKETAQLNILRVGLLLLCENTQNGEAKSFSGSPRRTHKGKKLGEKNKKQGSVQIPGLLKEAASRSHSHRKRRNDQKKTLPVEIWKKIH